MEKDFLSSQNEQFWFDICFHRAQKYLFFSVSRMSIMAFKGRKEVEKQGNPRLLIIDF
jgi:hypothetical protein